MTKTISDALRAGEIEGDLITGIARCSLETLDNCGITIHVRDTERRYRAALRLPYRRRHGRPRLSLRQRKQAYLDAMLRHPAVAPT
jgi:hypothetical protein